MRAMLLREPRMPLEAADLPIPERGEGQLLLRVEACAVCRTDLHVVDGELPEPKLPVIPGHQIVGIDEKSGKRFGVPWLGWTCGVCAYCTSGNENLCDSARFTGYTLDGGYAEYVVADERYCFPIPDDYTSEEAAPLLCAGLIGFRAYRFALERRGQSAERRHDGVESLRSAVCALRSNLGFYGFGSAAQILTQLAVADGHTVHAFTRDSDTAAQQFALRMGAASAGNASDAPPEPLDAAILFAPAGELVVSALKHVRKGGIVVCAGIHMSDIPSFPYSLLWGERQIVSVANLTREDGVSFFHRLESLRIRTERTLYPLESANEALATLRSGELTGTAVLQP